jgi:cell division septum initiation protein DivIVA
MSRDRDELLERARKEAERVIAEAQEQRDRLLSRTEIVHAGEREAERITDKAKERAAKVRAEAEDYVDQKLAAFEILLNKTLATVSRGREQLRGDPGTIVDTGEQPAVHEGVDVPLNGELSEPLR